MLFSEIIGLEDIKTALTGSVKRSHVAHAQLFVGNEGSANLALALAYAQFINCEDRSEIDSCGQCTSCTQYKKLVHPDLHFMFPMTSLEKVHKDDLKALLLKQYRQFALEQTYGSIQEWGSFVGAENKQFNIPVEEGRNLMQHISLKPYQSDYKIILIWLPEFMHISTANAILKVLEEPTDKTVFLLVSTDYEKLLTTIISRCQLTNVRAFSDEETKIFLIKKGVADDKTAARISKIAEGNLNRALMLAEDSEDDNHALFANWMRLCFSRKYAELLQFSDEVSKKGRENQKNLLIYSLQIIRDALMNKLNIAELIRQEEDELKFIQNFSKAVDENYVERLYFELNETYRHIERNGNAKIIFFDTSVRIGKLFQR